MDVSPWLSAQNRRLHSVACVGALYAAEGGHVAADMKTLQATDGFKPLVPANATRDTRGVSTGPPMCDVQVQWA